MRHFFCFGSVVCASGICPVREFWPAVRRATDIGNYLFGCIRRKNINRFLKASLPTIQIIDAGRYSRRWSCHGCIVYIKRAGSTLSVILGYGGWRSAGFVSYVSLREDEEAVRKALLRQIEVCRVADDNYSDSDKSTSQAPPPLPPQWRRVYIVAIIAIPTPRERFRQIRYVIDNIWGG